MVVYYKITLQYKYVCLFSNHKLLYSTNMIFFYKHVCLFSNYKLLYSRNMMIFFVKLQFCLNLDDINVVSTIMFVCLEITIQYKYDLFFCQITNYFTVQIWLFFVKSQLFNIDDINVVSLIVLISSNYFKAANFQKIFTFWSHLQTTTEKFDPIETIWILAPFL